MNHKKADTKSILKRNGALILMVLPAVVLMFLFTYVPKFGLILAFKEYSFVDGIWGSAWNGIENFRYIFSSGELMKTVGVTIGYHYAHSITMHICAIVVSIMLYIVGKKAANKFRFVITMPFLASMNVIAAVVYIFLRYDGGLINSLLETLGQESVAWYLTPSIWPFILVFVNSWYGAGIRSIYFYSIFMGIDSSLFEAIDMDGGSWRHKIRYVMLPSIVPILCLFLITDIGTLLNSNFALYHSVPMNSSALSAVTNVLSMYEYRGLTMGNIGTTAAVGLFTGVIQLLALHLCNSVVKKISPENSLY